MVKSYGFLTIFLPFVCGSARDVADMRAYSKADLLGSGAAIVLAAAMLAAGPPLLGLGMTVAVAAWWCVHLERDPTPR
jgi:hypothetical protein